MLKVSIYTWKALSSDGRSKVFYSRGSEYARCCEWLEENDPLAADDEGLGSFPITKGHSLYREVTFVPIKESK